MSKLLIATGNPGKVKEIKHLMAGIYDEVLSLKDAGLDIDTIEDADTFEGNARKKALEAFEASGMDTLADDSGLCVDSLNGAPGVYSARYAGESATDVDNNVKLIDVMQDVPQEKRGARFVCTLVLVRAGKPELVTKGACEGEITKRPAGDGGFGYDPYFYVPQYDKNMAQLTADEKNAISHRGKALAKLKAKLVQEQK